MMRDAWYLPVVHATMKHKSGQSSAEYRQCVCSVAADRSTANQTWDPPAGSEEIIRSLVSTDKWVVLLIDSPDLCLVNVAV